MDTQNSPLYIDQIPGTRNRYTISFALFVLLGALGFLRATIASFCSNEEPLSGVLPVASIPFAPQGAVMCFYGLAALFFSSYLLILFVLNIGGGYNELDSQIGLISVCRWGFPGPYRCIRICCLIEDVEAISLQAPEDSSFRQHIVLRLRDNTLIPIYGQAFSLDQLETKAAKLASLLRVPIERVF